MNKRWEVVLTCDNCGKEFVCTHKKRLQNKHKFCSRECLSSFRKENNPNMRTCPVCGTKFYKQPSHIGKNGIAVCSAKCWGKFVTQTGLYDKEKNPNWGNRGINNPLWKGDIKISPYGYRLIKYPEHPFANCDGYVFEHRMVVESHLLTTENSIEIDGKRYLSPEYIVHHIDGNRLNNSPDNLSVMRRDEHTKMHHKLRKQNP